MPRLKKEAKNYMQAQSNTVMAKPRPVCYYPSKNIGMVRFLGMTLIPVLIVAVVVIIINEVVRAREKRKHRGMQEVHAREIAKRDDEIRDEAKKMVKRHHMRTAPARSLSACRRTTCLGRTGTRGRRRARTSSSCEAAHSPRARWRALAGGARGRAAPTARSVRSAREVVENGEVSARLERQVC